MRLLLIAACLAGIIVAAGPANADTVPKGVTCKAFLVYDRNNERVIGSANHELSAPIASLTKLMTAILVCERMRFDGRYVLNAREREIFNVETMRAGKMLELMLVASNNNICKVAARIISGSEEAFAKEMNAKALQLGLADTVFVNSTGLPGKGQHSNLVDLLQLTRVALAYPRIRQATTGRSVELDGKRYDSTLRQLYDRHAGLIGGKTGYTRAAGRCLVLRYQANGREYLVITLGSKSIASGFKDAELVLFHYGLYNGEIGTWDG